MGISPSPFVSSEKVRAGDPAMEAGSAPAREAASSQRALEDGPSGPPTVYGPMHGQRGREVAMNPFWSDRAKEEATICSLRPQGLPDPDGQEIPGTSRPVVRPEDLGQDVPSMQQLLAMVLQQNGQLKRELDELKGKVEAQPPVTRVVEQVVVREVERGVKPVENPQLSIQDQAQKPLPLEDVKSDGVETQAVGEWKTPPESVAPNRVVGSEAPVEKLTEEPPVSGIAGSANGAEQQQVLCQVTQALSALVAQLSATAGNQSAGGQVPPCGQGGRHVVDLSRGGGLHPIGFEGHLPSGGHGQDPPLGGGGMGGGGMGGPNLPRMAPFQLPQELTWFQGAGESIRTVDLPPLPGIKEGELGGVVIGDWLTLISPVMRDLSVSSGAWWEAVLQEAQTAYDMWLHSEPLQRLYISPSVPGECRTTWARLEQRGQSMLLQALPESLKAEMLAGRITHSVEIIFRVFTRYQPGGLGEKALLLRQLVDGKAPAGIGEFLEQVRGWKRNLRRAQELKVATPDPTLLMGALDRMSSSIIKSSNQLAFRLNSTRAQLMVDINPTLTGVTNYADAIMAEAEGLLHAGAQAPATAKVKAIDGPPPDLLPQPKGGGKGKSDEKGKSGKGRAPCKYFGTPDGCKKGADCTFLHDWDSIDKRGRCWTCSSTKHAKKECTVKAVAGGGSDGAKGKKIGEAVQPPPSLKKSESKEDTESEKGTVENGSTEKPGGEATSTSTAPAAELIKEATSLLKSLKIPALKAVRISSLEVKGGGRALLDGGATHALRTAADLHEWNLERKSKWEGTVFELTDPMGCVVDSKLEGSCPTVTEELGLELIKEVEKFHLERRARLAVLRGEGNIGGLHQDEVKRLEELRGMFPLVPEHLLVRILPSQKAAGSYNEGDLPWNRRQRKRLRRAQQVVIHLFSGKDEKFWKKELENQHRAVLCVDTELDSRHNLLRDDVMEFLLELADGGNTAAWLGGPPCRTMSRLRYRQPGPPPLRSREGVERFGLHGLDESLKKRVEDDTVLWLRQYYLYHRAKRASLKKVLYLSEQPEDPERYMDTEAIAKQRYPSYWSFPEWEWMRNANDFIEIHFDQGPTGHETRKPTTLGTNIYELQSLNGIRGPGTSSRTTSDWELSIEERIAKSKSWAAWSGGIKAAIATAIKRELDPRLRKMSLDQWKIHLQNDHQPYYRGCRTCLEACGQSRHHRKIDTPESYTLGIDLAGPFKKGLDQLGEGRYMLVGTFTLPTTPEGRPLHLKEESKGPDDRCRNPGGEGDGSAVSGVPNGPAGSCRSPGGEGDGSAAAGEPEDLHVEGGIFDDGEPAGEDPLEIQDDDGVESPKDEKEDDRQKWLEKIEEEQKFKVGQLTFMEIFPDRRGPSVMAGVSRIHARLRYLGLPLLRLHSDRAGELRSKILRRWAEDRQVMRTYTDGDSFKSNGRTEAAIGLIKRHTRTLLKQTSQPPTMWPLAARHAAERKLRQQLSEFGIPVGKMLPYGSTAYARQKIWNEKYQDWKLSRREVTICGPDVAMSASMAGHYVKGTDGKFFHTSDAVQAEGPPPEALEDGLEDRPEIGNVREPGQRMRIYGKTTMMSSLQIPMEEAEHRRLRGLKLLMEELEMNDSKTDEEIGNDPFIRALMKDVEDLASGLDEDGKLQQEVELSETEKAAEDQEVFLQTRSYSLAEVRADIEAWKASMESEFKALTEETGAIKVITEDEAERLRKDAERLKAWSAVTLDVKTAFLRAPKDHSSEVVIVQPPQIFILAGICAPGTLWWVDRAMYGLITSPKEWLQYRNQRVIDFKWTVENITYMVEKTGDPDIWRIVKEEAAENGPADRCRNPRGEGDGSAVAGEPREAAGYFVTYVDDVLAVGDQSVLSGFCQRMKEEWEVGEPDWLKDGGPAVRFLGMEIELKNGVYGIHQQAYIQNLLEKYPGEKGHGLSAIKTPEEEEKPSAHDVQVAQRQTGELLWLAGRTRPDISYGVSLMSQYATKRPKGVQAIGREVRNYLRTSQDLTLHYGPLEEGDFGEEGSQRRARHENLVEIYTDSSYASSDLKSISGVVGFYAGAPVFWLTCRQSFITLSTAESELMSMLEGLTALRCVKSIVEMLQPGPVEGRMYSDSTAGISIVSGTTGSWRTRHLRIRAQGLREAIERGESTLDHQSGRLLVADGMTKQLQGTLLKHFVQALKMSQEHVQAVKVSALKVDGSGKMGPQVQSLREGIGLLIAASSLLLTPVEAAETISPGDDDSGLGMILTMLVIGVLIIGDLVTRFGLPRLRSWVCPREELKVKLLNESAVLPTRGTTGSAGLDLSSSENYKIGPGEYLLVKTGLAVELPYGTYGRLASRSSMAKMGIEVSAGVIDRDFRGEIKVLVHNQSGRDFWVRKGDRIAQMIVERMMEVEVHQVSALSETSRGRMGFGSTGVEPLEGADVSTSRAVRTLRVGSEAYDGGSSATNIEGPWSMSSNPDGGATMRPSMSTSQQSSMARGDLEIPDGIAPVQRCRAPRKEAGTASTVPQMTTSSTQTVDSRSVRRVTAEELIQRRPPTPPTTIVGGAEYGATSQPSTTTSALRSSTTSVMDGPPANLGLCPIGAPLPGDWYQRSASLVDRAKCLKVQMKDIIPEEQPELVRGCPGLVSWDLMRPHQWTSNQGESLEEVVDRSGLAQFWPLHMEGLWKLLEEEPKSPKRDRWEELPINAAHVLMVRIHAVPRRKVYDFKNESMRGMWNYGSRQLTIAKLVGGNYELIAGHRFGNGNPFLDDQWTGATCYIKSKGA
eukprot:s1305_g23.t1